MSYLASLILAKNTYLTKSMSSRCIFSPESAPTTVAGQIGAAIVGAVVLGGTLIGIAETGRAIHKRLSKAQGEGKTKSRKEVIIQDLKFYKYLSLSEGALCSFVGGASVTGKFPVDNFAQAAFLRNGPILIGLITCGLSARSYVQAQKELRELR